MADRLSHDELALDLLKRYQDHCQALDVVCTKFLGYDVISLSECRDEWYPLIKAEERKKYMMRMAFYSEEPDGDVVEVQFKPGLVGHWKPVHLETFRDMNYAWRVYQKIVTNYDTTAYVEDHEVCFACDYMGPTEIVTGKDAAHAICLAAAFLMESGAKPIPIRPVA